MKKLKIIIGLLFCIVILFVIWPLPNELKNPIEQQPVNILDRNGKMLYEARKSDFGSQEYLVFEKIPKNIIDILISVEDKTFYHHSGISLKGILRAAYQNYKAGKIVSGGSTITQQLVRNRLKPEKRGYLYKMKEILLALKLEMKMTKNEILESYLNDVYFGHQAYGAQAAAKTFFNKNLTELSLAESSLLIGLIQSPASYDPFINFDLAKKRQQTVIDSMRESGKFSESDLENIESEPIKLSSGKIDIKAPHFVMMIMGQENLDDSEIKTTLDLDLQSEIELIVQNKLKDLEDKNVTSSAVVVIDAINGELLAMVGSADYFDEEHDGAVNVALANRQPGSALKPFTYAIALNQGKTAASTVADIETQFFTQDGNPYIPRNYDYGYHGLVRYRESLANSYNIAAVKVLEDVGVKNLMTFLSKAGITTLTEPPEHYGLALTLGDAEVKLLELATAYGMFARGGRTLEIKTLLDDKTEEGKRILDEKIAWLITDILDDDIARLPEFGENGPLEFDFPVAAKTGTTRNSRDNWTIGYTPDIIVGVWVGNADNTPMKNTSGITGAGPIFHETMLAATKNKPNRSFKKPGGIYATEICKLSGKLPTEHCPHTMNEWFIVGTEPKKLDDMYTLIQIDTRNELLANSNCPVDFIKEEVFVIFPPELKTWARENGFPSPPNLYSPLCEEKNEESKAQGEEVEWIIIQKPNANESFLLDPLIPDENEKIIFQASASNNISLINWFVNDEKVGTGKSPAFRYEWQPEIGKFQIKAISGELEEIKNIEVLAN